jgi:hypothetical protein
MSGFGMQRCRDFASSGPSFTLEVHSSLPMPFCVPLYGAAFDDAHHRSRGCNGSELKARII